MATNIEFSYDEKTYRHYINGVSVVSHPHHYTIALIQMAESLADYGGIDILAESMEDAMRPVLDALHKDNDVVSTEEKLAEAQKYYDYIGIGLMKVSGDQNGGEVTLTRSHVDEAWLTKFGQRDSAVNHLTRGLIAAMFASAYDYPGQSYQVEETSSLVKGDDASRFTVKLK